MQKNGVDTKKYFDRAIRYWKNGKATIKDVGIKYGAIYEDEKPVREACGIAYLGVVEAANGFFLSRGVDKKKLPQSDDAILQMLSKHNIKNGKVIKHFTIAYHLLHEFGYYHGNTSVETIKKGFQSAREFIEMLTDRKV